MGNEQRLQIEDTTIVIFEDASMEETWVQANSAVVVSRLRVGNGAVMIKIRSGCRDRGTWISKFGQEHEVQEKQIPGLSPGCVQMTKGEIRQ